MNFFYAGKKADTRRVEGYSLDLLHASGCAICPLRREWSQLDHPDMKPSGSMEPDVYMLGEAPGQEEDERGRPFVGKAGKVLRFRIPPSWDHRLRWNNTVRTRPPENRDPTRIEMECCRPSIIRDIEQTKPRAIFGFGNVPLQWAINGSKITLWRGRKVPVRVGSHTCWYYPMIHPSAIARKRRWEPNHQNEYPSDDEFAFAHDLKVAFAEVMSLPDPVVHSREMAITGLRSITDPDHAVEFLNLLTDTLTEKDIAGFDFETNMLRPYNDDARILSAAIALKDESVSFPVDHPRSGWSRAQVKRVMEALALFLKNAKCRKVSHHLQFEYEWTEVILGPSSGWEDSESQAYVIDERRGALSLEFLCLQHFGLDVKAINNLDRKRLVGAPLEDLLTYNALDAKYHRLLYLRQRTIINDLKLNGVYKHQLRRVFSATKVQIKGVPIDTPQVLKFDAHYRKRMRLVANEIRKLPEARRFQQTFGKPYNALSFHDVRKAVTRLLRVRVENVTEDTIGKIDHPLMKLTVRYRKLNKLHGTYVKPLLPDAPTVYDDGLLHPQLNVCATDTWRTSSDGPNVQNFPKRKTRQVRRQVKHKFLKIVAFDFAGIQARNVAMESKDAALVNAFWHNYDIHKDWCNRIDKRCRGWFKGDRQDKDTFKSYRHRAKNEFVFPSFFGAQPQSLAGYLGIDVRDAEYLSEMFWSEFPDIHKWHERLKRNYLKYGYVTGLSGFRRHAPISQNKIINSPIQADESRVVLAAMAALTEKGDDRLVPMMEIHDDLTFLWDKSEIDKLSEIVIAEMLQHRFKWINVPLGVEMLLGDDWEHVKEIGAYSSDKWYGFKQPTTLAMGGAWDDGTGWANHQGSEKARSRR